MFLNIEKLLKYFLSISKVSKEDIVRKNTQEKMILKVF